MKTNLSVALLASIIACGIASSNSTAKAAPAKPDFATAIKTVNADKAPAILNKPGYDQKLLEGAMIDFMVCKGLVTEENVSKGLINRTYQLIRMVDHKDFTAAGLAYVLSTDVQPDGNMFVTYNEKAQHSAVAIENQKKLDAEIAAINDSDLSRSEKAAEREKAKKSIPCDHIHKTSADGKFVTPVLATFEEVLQAPDVIQAGFENQPGTSRPGIWHAELNDEYSKYQVMKSLYTGIIYSGLTLEFAKEPNGKFSWDPTPGRTWKPISAKYDFLEGAMRVEIYDGFSELLDRDYAGAVKGAEYKMVPWSSGALRQIMIDGKLEEVLSPELAKKLTEKSETTEDGDTTDEGDGGFGISVQP